MKNETDVNYVIQYIEDKIKPYSLNEIGKSKSIKKSRME